MNIQTGACIGTYIFNSTRIDIYTYIYILDTGPSGSKDMKQINAARWKMHPMDQQN